MLVADRLLGVNDLRRRSGGARALRAGAVLRGLHRPARPAPARPGSGGDARRGLARGATGARGHERRRAGAQGASAPGRDQRHGAQHHHQHAPDLRRRLGEAVRGGESGRRCPARRQRFRRHGFRHPQPLPHRHRADGPRHRPGRARDRAARPSGRLVGARYLRWRSPSTRSRLSPDRRRPPRLRAFPGFPPARPRLAPALRGARGSRAMSPVFP